VAFSGDPISTIAIPAGVTSIGGAAFEDCALTNLVICNSNLTIGGWAFLGNPLASVTLLGNVNILDDQVFDFCYNLTNIVIGAGVSNLSYGMFANCGKPANVLFLGNAPGVIGSYPSDGPVFWGDINTTVYYLPGTKGWGSSYQGAPTALWNPAIQTSDPGFGVSKSHFGFNITDSSNRTIVVQACANLAHPVWTILATDTLTSGSAYFSDPQWTNYPSRFYRVASQASGGQPPLVWNPQAQTSDEFGFNITGSSDIPVSVVACTNLSNPVWTSLTNVTLTNGFLHFSDPQWTNYPARFYGIGFP
jgi:hypothetical protein